MINTLDTTSTTLSEVEKFQLNNAAEKTFEEVVNDVSENISYKVASKYVPVILREDYVEIDLGNGSKKSISYADFRNIIGKTINDVSDVQITGLLPPSNVFFISQTSKEIRLSCYYPTAIRNLKYMDAKMDIVTPNMIISHTLYKDKEDWVVKDTRFFCTDLPLSKLPKTFISVANPSDRIFLSAMSNTYNDGRMCYGGNSMPVRFKDNNLRGLDYYFKFLWETPFNNDLGIYGLGSGRDGVNGWYKHLASLAKDKKVYPYERLSGWRADPMVIPANPI